MAAGVSPRTGVSSLSHQRANPLLPHGVLSAAALVPTVEKLPFLALALVALAILLLALGALPASTVPHPFFAMLLNEHQRVLAYGGLAILGASITAYLLA